MDDFTALVASCKFVSDFSRSAAFGLDCLSNAFASSSAFCRESRVLSSETAPSLSANVCWASETADCSFCLAVSIFFCSWLFVTALAAVVTALAPEQIRYRHLLPFTDVSHFTLGVTLLRGMPRCRTRPTGAQYHYGGRMAASYRFCREYVDKETPSMSVDIPTFMLGVFIYEVLSLQQTAICANVPL